jgi:ketosteroid isomerase-like protein
MWAGGPPKPVRPIRSHSLAITPSEVTARVHTGSGVAEPNPNIPLIAELLVAYREGDDEKFRELMHPDGEVYGDPSIINSGTYRGFEGFQRWVREWEEAWEGISYELGEIVGVSESILVAPVHVVGRGAGSGVQIDTVFGWLYEWRDGRLSRFHVYATVEDALEAAAALAREPA